MGLKLNPITGKLDQVENFNQGLGVWEFAGWTEGAADADPGVGKVIFDDGGLAGYTLLISYTDKNGYDFYANFFILYGGFADYYDYFIEFRSKSNPSKFLKFFLNDVDEPGADAWWKLSGTGIAGTLYVEEGDYVSVDFEEGEDVTISLDMAFNPDYIGTLGKQDSDDVSITGGSISGVSLTLETFYRQVMFSFNFGRIQAATKPTLVTVGIFNGYSLPIYNSDNEELFGCVSMPEDWDGTTDPVIYISGWLDSANNAKKFKLQVSVERGDMASNTVVSATAIDFTVETTTGNWAQYTSFKASVTVSIAWVGLVAGQILAIRVRRIAASSAEAAGEVVIEGALLYYVCDKLGVEVT